jgi:hypothetical protein
LNEKYEFLYSFKKLGGLIESDFSILGRYFSFISSLDEKKGGIKRMDLDIHAFNYFI